MGTQNQGNGPIRWSAGMGGDGDVSALPLSYGKVSLPGGIRTRDLSLPMRSNRSLHLARMGSHRSFISCPGMSGSGVVS